MRSLRIAALCFVVVAMGCGRPAPNDRGERPKAGRDSAPTKTLTEARTTFQTQLRPVAARPIPAPEPDAIFETVRYESPAGKLVAYLTPDPGDGRKHPAIIWITGGDSNTIGDVWTPRSPQNDQTAGSYHEAGLVMMFPSQRGGNDNPGVREGFYGEVDDILAAADHLAGLDYVDPRRIYLGGHSTGGTLALLVAASSDRFRAVFSFGPVFNVADYGPDFAPFDQRNPEEFVVRSPGYWLHGVRSPTFVIEGTVDGNASDLDRMARVTENPKTKFLPVKGANHFDVLAPVNGLIARKILRDTGPECQISLTEEELERAFRAGLDGP